MDSPLPHVATALALLLAVIAVVHIAGNRPVGRFLVGCVALLEIVLLVFVVVAIAQLIGSDRDISRATLIGYLLGAVAIPPVALLWSLDERDRYGTAVLLVALLVLPVMVLRLQQIWAGPVA